MRKSRFAATVLLLGLLASGFARAEDTVGIAAGAEVGTMGFGLSLGASLTDQLAGRAILRYLSADAELDASDNNGTSGDELRHEGTAKIQGLLGVLDWYPTSSSFYVSGGLMYNDSEIKATSTCNNAGGCEIGDGQGGTRLPQGDTISSRVTVNELAPYLGIGWGNPFAEGSGFGWRADAGVLYQGSPKIDLSYSGVCSGTLAAQNCQNEVEKEEQELEKDVEDYQFYPVLQVSLYYRF